MSRKIQCTKVSELPGYEEAKLWWRSRTPQERDAGISYHLDGITDMRIIEVPKPFCGRIKVTVSGMKQHRQKVVNVSKRQLNSLRRLFSLPGHRGWRLRETSKAVLFIRGGELFTWEALHEEFGS